MTKFELTSIPAFDRTRGLVVVNGIVTTSFEVVDDKIFTTHEVEIKDGYAVQTYFGVDVYTEMDGALLQRIQLLDAEKLKFFPFREEILGEFYLTEVDGIYSFRNSEKGYKAVPIYNTDEDHTVLVGKFDLGNNVEEVWVVVDIKTLP